MLGDFRSTMVHDCLSIQSLTAHTAVDCIILWMVAREALETELKFCWTHFYVNFFT